MNVEQRIARLEAELQLLRAERPAAPLNSSPRRPQDSDPVWPFVMLFPEQTRFVRPNARELRQLYGVVLAKYPKLGPLKSITHSWASVGEAEHYAGFASAFERLGFIGRTAQPDKRYYLGHWLSDCRDWLARHRRTAHAQSAPNAESELG